MDKIKRIPVKKQNTKISKNNKVTGKRVYVKKKKKESEYSFKNIVRCIFFLPLEFFVMYLIFIFLSKI